MQTDPGVLTEEDRAAVLAARPKMRNIALLPLIFIVMAVVELSLPSRMLNFLGLLTLLGGLLVVCLLPFAVRTLTRKILTDLTNGAVNQFTGTVRAVSTGKAIKQDDTGDLISVIDARKLLEPFGEGTLLRCRISRQARVLLSVEQI